MARELCDCLSNSGCIAYSENSIQLIINVLLENYEYSILIMLKFKNLSVNTLFALLCPNFNIKQL